MQNFRNTSLILSDLDRRLSSIAFMTCRRRVLSGGSLGRLDDCLSKAGLTGWGRDVPNMPQTNKKVSYLKLIWCFNWLSTLEAWNSFSLPSNKSVAIHLVSVSEDLGDGVSTHLLDADGQLRTWATWREIADCAYPVGQTWNYDEIWMFPKIVVPPNHPF